MKKTYIVLANPNLVTTDYAVRGIKTKKITLKLYSKSSTVKLAKWNRMHVIFETLLILDWNK